MILLGRLHALIVHFPIALLMVVVVMALWARRRQQPRPLRSLDLGRRGVRVKHIVDIRDPPRRESSVKRAARGAVRGEIPRGEQVNRVLMQDVPDVDEQLEWEVHQLNVDRHRAHRLLHVHLGLAIALVQESWGNARHAARAHRSSAASASRGACHVRCHGTKYPSTMDPW